MWNIISTFVIIIAVIVFIIAVIRANLLQEKESAFSLMRTPLQNMIILLNMIVLNLACRMKR